MAKRFARRCEHSSGQASLQTEQPIASQPYLVLQLMPYLSSHGQPILQWAQCCAKPFAVFRIQGRIRQNPWTTRMYMKLRDDYKENPSMRHPYTRSPTRLRDCVTPTSVAQPCDPSARAWVTAQPLHVKG
jgi:hypothetical protein